MLDFLPDPESSQSPLLSPRFVMYRTTNVWSDPVSLWFLTDESSLACCVRHVSTRTQLCFDFAFREPALAKSISLEQTVKPRLPQNTQTIVISRPMWSTVCPIPIVTRTIDSSLTTRPSPHQQTAIPDRAHTKAGKQRVFSKTRWTGNCHQKPMLGIFCCHSRKRPTTNAFNTFARTNRTTSPCRSTYHVRRTPVQLTTIGFLRGEGECVGSYVGEKG